MSFYFVNLSDFMGLVAKKMQEKKSKFLIFNFLGKVSWGRKWRTHGSELFMFFQKKKKKINLTNFFSF